MQRRHDLDWLRVIAVFLLLPFHSARVFDPFEDFYVHSAATSEALFWSVIAFIGQWQMELLFVLAGAASWYAFGRRNAHEYRIERVKRLLVPFLFGLVVIVPIQSYLAIVWRDGSASIPAFTTDYWTMQGEALGYDGGFTPGHLWFILFLFVYSMVAAPLFARWRSRTGPRRWVPWYLFLMPLVMFLSDAVSWPEDGPAEPLLLVRDVRRRVPARVGTAPGGRDRRRVAVACAGGGSDGRRADVALDLGDRRPLGRRGRCRSCSTSGRRRSPG